MEIIKPSEYREPKSQVDLFLEYISSKLDFVGTEAKSLHVPDKMIVPIEAELLKSPHYYKQIPISYPQYAYEEDLRRIINPMIGGYKTTTIRFGKTELHLQTMGSAKNLESAFLFYLGKGEMAGDGKTSPKTYLSKDYVGIALHENGAISAVYSNLPEVFPEKLSKEPPYLSAAVSWYPGDKKDLGLLVYPSSAQEVDESMRFAWDTVKEVYSQKGVPLKTGSGLGKIADFVMLAVETRESVVG